MKQVTFLSFQSKIFIWFDNNPFSSGITLSGKKFHVHKQVYRYVHGISYRKGLIPGVPEIRVFVYDFILKRLCDNLINMLIDVLVEKSTEKNSYGGVRIRTPLFFFNFTEHSVFFSLQLSQRA